TSAGRDASAARTWLRLLRTCTAGRRGAHAVRRRGGPGRGLGRRLGRAGRCAGGARAFQAGAERVKNQIPAVFLRDAALFQPPHPSPARLERIVPLVCRYSWSLFVFAYSWEAAANKSKEIERK